MILLYILMALSIALVVLTLDCTFSKYLKEDFTNFKIDEKQIFNENSIRFLRHKPLNDQRGAFAFKNINYFVKNKDNIFKFYNIDERIIRFYDENHSKPFERIPDKPKSDSNFKQDYFNKLNSKNGNRNEVGLGFDKKSNSSKIYILDNTTIKSLKIKNGNQIESIYNIVPNFDEKIMNDFFGEKNTEIISKNLSEIIIVENDFTSNFDRNGILLKVFGKEKVEEMKKNLAKFDSNKRKVPLKIEKINCYDRYDNNELIGYHFDMGPYNLKFGKDRNFVKNLLNDLDFNIDNIDRFIDNNSNKIISWISFIKLKGEYCVTIYYRD